MTPLYRECGCVEKEWSTNQYVTLSYCDRHYGELTWDSQKHEVVTDETTLKHIEKLFEEPEEEDEPEDPSYTYDPDAWIYEEYDSYDDLPLHLL